MPKSKPITINPPSAASSPASADSISASKQQVFRTAWQVEIDPTLAAPCCKTDFPMPANTKTCAPACRHLHLLTLSSAASLAKTFHQWASSAGWPARAQACSSMQCTSSPPSNPVFSYLKMSLVCCFQTMAATSKQSLKRLPNAGMWDFGACWTAVISGVPTKRRRVFMVAGLGELPPLDFMGDAGPMARLSGQTEPQSSAWADAQPTLLAGFSDGTSIDISGGNIVAVADARHQMVERARASEHHGFRRGLDAANACEARAAGNAVCPPVAQWIAKKLITTFQAV